MKIRAKCTVKLFGPDVPAPTTENPNQTKKGPCVQVGLWPVEDSAEFAAFFEARPGQTPGGGIHLFGLSDEAAASFTEGAEVLIDFVPAPAAAAAAPAPAAQEPTS